MNKISELKGSSARRAARAVYAYLKSVNPNREYFPDDIAELADRCHFSFFLDGDISSIASNWMDIVRNY